MSEGKVVEFTCTSLVSNKDKSARVNISFDDFKTQLSADEAISLAKNIFEVASMAQADAFLFNWLQEKVFIDNTETTEKIAIEMIRDFRDWRFKLAEEFQKTQPTEPFKPATGEKI